MIMMTNGLKYLLVIVLTASFGLTAFLYQPVSINAQEERGGEVSVPVFLFHLEYDSGQLIVDSDFKTPYEVSTTDEFEYPVVRPYGLYYVRLLDEKSRVLGEYHVDQLQSDPLLKSGKITAQAQYFFKAVKAQFFSDQNRELLTVSIDCAKFCNVPAIANIQTQPTNESVSEASSINASSTIPYYIIVPIIGLILILTICGFVWRYKQMSLDSFSNRGKFVMGLVALFVLFIFGFTIYYFAPTSSNSNKGLTESDHVVFTTDYNQEVTLKNFIDSASDPVNGKVLIFDNPNTARFEYDSLNRRFILTYHEPTQVLLEKKKSATEKAILDSLGIIASEACILPIDVKNDIILIKPLDDYLFLNMCEEFFNNTH